MQRDHLRHQRTVLVRRRGDEARERAFIVLDVRVGEPPVRRPRAGRARCRDALCERPHLAGPAVGTRAAGDDVRAMRGAATRDRRPRDHSCTVVAAVVDERDRERAGVVLREQGRQRTGDHVRLVARRDDRVHVRRRIARRGLTEAVRTRIPKATASDGEADPRRRRHPRRSPQRF